jgi:hypothetical protein
MPTTYPITWDGTGMRKYESGVSKGVLYPIDPTTGRYGTGVAWNGLISVSNNPDGAEPNELWADNIKYAILRSAETLSLTIEAYTYPAEFEACDGMASPSGAAGLTLGQQARQAFGFCYRTEVGTDADGEAGYKLHLVYGCTATPSDKDYETINDNPDAITFSWDVDTVPVNVTGYKPVSEIVVDSIAAGKEHMTALENKLYGNGSTAPALPAPDDVITTLGGTISNVANP